MKLSLFSPKQSLNKAYLKEKVSRTDIELFKKNLTILSSKINEQESEEHHKYPVADFLKDTWYKDQFEINTKGRSDFVIHSGKTTKDPVGVIIEVKRPVNKSEMMSVAKPNAKALHELILYYLQERIIHQNTAIKYLIATNIYEWFIIDEVWFDKHVYRNNKLRKHYEEDYKQGGHDTKFFYDSIAKPFLDTLEEPLPCTYFNFRDFETIITNNDQKDDSKLIALYKILSPAHLLKQAFGNDSNSLDPRFYTELLHIIGLEEIKDGGKKLIKRKLKPDDASLLENTILKLEDKESLRNIPNLSQYGNTRADQLFNVALELCITWVNRILFLKLLEAQLYNYHKGKKEYQFLNTGLIHDYDELNNLFFQVLAEKPATRKDNVKEKFSKIPYLNSSLFERTELERKTFDIGGLDNRLELSLAFSTVLKNEQGKRRIGKALTLSYFFDFLNAYDFTSEGSEEIQEENKNLINASVLGLIFEKINGYKDGSFFTPGFITMYMCRETIRRAVVQKFNEKHSIDCETFEDLKNFVGRKFKQKDVLDHNALINSLKICDPAVGSGHFLVSALNELIAIKAELNILADKEGLMLSGYEVKIENDELIITYNNNTEIFEYTLTGNSIDPKIQRVQKTLFHEKETLIENCLFGVDINPNSVKICRLRLWIELLKNAYYTEESKFLELETLPNIDINIKCGNSLVSRYSLDSDLKSALKKSKWNIESYKLAVHSYHHASSKEEKRQIEDLIDSIKSNFETEIAKYSDPRVKRLQKLGEQLYNLTGKGRGGKGIIMFEPELKGNKELEKKRKKEIEKIEAEINKLSTKIEGVISNKIYENAFEWRIEFPEVLDNEGGFVGFDVVIGNPPYFSVSKVKEFADYFNDNFQTYSKGSDVYCLFYEKGSKILNTGGLLTYITSNSWLRSIYGDLLKTYFTQKLRPIHLLNIEDIQIFEEATVESNILTLRNQPVLTSFHVANLGKDYHPNLSLTEYVKNNSFEFFIPDSTNWDIGDQELGQLKQKIEKDNKLLKDYDVSINRGFLTGLNEAFIIGEDVRNKLVQEDANNEAILKPILRGRDLKKYSYEFSGFYLINSHNGVKTKNIQRINVEKDYPIILKHFENFKPQVENRYDQGDHWTNLRNCAYLEDFQKPKIVWGEISDKPKFAFDDSGLYAEATTFIMTGDKLKFLLAILNSNVSKWYFKQIGTTTGMGTNRWKKYKIELLPIKLPTADMESLLVDLVDQIITHKKSNPNTVTSELEKEIDQLVYQLYGLTEEEIRIVEGETV